jgi:hypothetical protein
MQNFDRVLGPHHAICVHDCKKWDGILNHLVLVRFTGRLWGLRKDPQKGREAVAPSNIKEIQEIQGEQEAPHDTGAVSPKDA